MEPYCDALPKLAVVWHVRPFGSEEVEPYWFASPKFGIVVIVPFGVVVVEPYWFALPKFGVE